MEPLISIVTPSYNQGQFLEATINSVLDQGYSNFRYSILDAGSTDASVDIIQKYEKYLYYWHSKPDSGPWSAILTGFKTAGEGGWFNWLNSDDLLLPGALSFLRDLIQLYPEARWISGARIDIDTSGRFMRHSCPWIDNPHTIALSDIFLPQDATFFRSDLFQMAANRVPNRLDNIFDSALHSVAWAIERPLLTDHVFSAMRWHGGQITSMKSDNRSIEAKSAAYQAIELPKSSLQKLLLRLISSRLRPYTSSLLRMLLTRGFAGSNQIKTCTYNQWRQDLVHSTVSDFYSLT